MHIMSTSSELIAYSAESSSPFAALRLHSARRLEHEPDFGDLVAGSVERRRHR